MPSLSINLLRQVPGVGATTVQSFIAKGYGSLDALQGISHEQLTAIPGVGAATADAILDFLARAGSGGDAVRSYRFDETRKNIPPAGLAAQGEVEKRPATRYFYDPHLPPVLRFDETGQADRLPDLLETARRRALTADEARLLAEALRTYQPWLEWTEKREKRWFDVDPVALHIHERLSAEAIVGLARRLPLQRSLFAEPELDFWEQVKFYEHDMDWTNRLILGDSLTVMHSLAKREDLAGKVQMIYIDPPYGIKFASNFQPFVNNREVKDREQDLTREPEQVKAYRDTWTLGIHSYLSYLRDRLIAAKELLADGGSILVQISDENVHRVRMLLDEVFGNENFVALVPFVTTSSQTSELLPSTCDFLIWYAKQLDTIKYRQIYLDKIAGETGGTKYTSVEMGSGESMSLASAVRLWDEQTLSSGRIYRPSPLVSQSGGESSRFPVQFNGQEFVPRTGFWKTNHDGFHRLINSERIRIEGRSLAYVRYLDDFGLYPLNSLWEDTWGVQSRSDPKVYVVQTATKIIERCLLMTTDPGDLVLDPTCGSGTTAYVAEQWGRRWITIDTSRVSIALARQRLLTAKFDYYELAKPRDGVNGGFIYVSVPHITLKSIAQNTALAPIFSRWESILTEKLESLNTALLYVTPEVRSALQRKLAAKEKQEGKRSITDADQRRWLLPKEKWEEWEVPFDVDPDWPQELQNALLDYRRAWRQKMNEVNATIQASAPQETLVDKPQVVKGVVRVSGTFTVEAVQPAEERMDLGVELSPIGGEPDNLETFTAGDVVALGEKSVTYRTGSPYGAGLGEPANAEAYLDKMTRLLRQDGVNFLGNQQVTIQELSPLAGSLSLHAEGAWNPSGEQSHRLAVSFGPQYGPLTAKQVEDALREAYRRGYDDVIFAGFTIDGAAQAAIAADPNPRVRCHLAHIRPDVLMGGLLKETPSSQLFTVTGLPRVLVHPAGDGDFEVEMEGVDIYDPVSNTIQATRAEKVAAWFLDSDYDGKTFCVTQAFFPDKSAWDKLAHALKSIVDPDLFDAFSGTRSLPFKAGENGRIAVKVIDPRGNEVMSVKYLEGVVAHG